MTKRFIFILAFLLVPLGAARGALDVEFGRYHALVIGINDYQNIPNLNTAVNDASAVADMLRQRYGFEVELLLTPTRDKVIPDTGPVARGADRARQFADLFRGARHPSTSKPTPDSGCPSTPRRTPRPTGSRSPR